MKEENKIIVSRDILPAIFLPLLMISGTILLLSMVLISDLFSLSGGNPKLVFGMLSTSILLFIIGIRKRIVFFDEKTSEISISWGARFPIILRKIPANNWLTFSITKEFPVGVFSYKGASRVYHLPPQWRLRGKTKSGKTINLGRFKTEADAESWKKLFIL